MRRVNATTVWLALLATTVLAGCGNDDLAAPGAPPAPAAPAAQPQPQPSAPVAEEDETDVRRESPSPSAAPADEGMLPMGTTKTQDEDGIKASVQAVAYKSGKYASYQVRVCNIKFKAGREFSVSRRPWSVIYGDEEYSTNLSSDGPKPELPESRILNEGQCVRGWLSFTLVGGRQPTGLDYQGAAGHFQWRNNR